MSDATLPALPVTAPFRAPTDEAPLARRALIALAVTGVAVLVLAPLLVVFAEALRTGEGESEGVRTYAPRPDERPEGFIPGLVKLPPNEAGLGTFFLLLPTLGARYDF